MKSDEILQFDFVSAYDVSESPEVEEWLDQFRDPSDDDYDEIGNAISTFEGDPDYVKVGNGRIYFYVNKERKFVLYLESDAEFDDRVKRIIAEYVGEGPSDIFTDRDVRSWDDFETVDVGVAYRGGSGYVYSLTEVDPAWWSANDPYTGK